MTDRKPAAPSGLSDRSKRLWRAVVADWELAAAELELLRGACVALDRADDAAAEVKKDGITVADRYGSPKAHPAAELELRSRALFARLIAQLGVKLGDEADDSPTTRRARRAADVRWGNVSRLEERRGPA